MFQVRPGEPVYAQVNRDKKKSSRMGPSDPMGLYHGANGGGGAGDYSEHADHWRVMQATPSGGQQVQVDSAGVPQPAAQGGQAGDSWV